MILGVGIDIIEVERVGKALDHHAARVFTQNERDYFAKFTNPAQHMAGTWAAKEAVAKALGTGFAGIDHREIEIIRENSGAPKVHLYGRAKQRLDELGGETVLVSISHVESMAVANAAISSNR